MDKRSWPWRKKSSEKTRIERALSSLESSGPSDISQGNKKKEGSNKKPSYVQISLESYSHLTGLEDQVKTYEDQVKTYEEQVNSYEDQVKALEDEIKAVNEKLSAAQTDIVNKEGLVKQHAKVAEDAVSGWEKAEAEALSLKNHLESVTLLKLAAEDRSSYLDNALKECLSQIRSLKEEHQQKLQEVILTQTKQREKIMLELEAKIGNLTQELLRSGAANDAISRSLQERSNMLFKISEEKSRAEAEIELLRSNLELSGKEINTLKYEVHIATKELEIRNEEKNMSVKSAEVANKQHLEDVKKIAKLEAECQRLRGLVRKKLPGPAALAQMKLEVENLDHNYGETPTRKSPVKSLEFSLDSVQKSHKENEFLTKRLLAMEEETKMLKEALAKRNSELLASRSYCAQTVNKLRSLESEVKANNELSITSTSPSFTAISKDGNNDEISCKASTSKLSHLKKVENGNHLEIMDDFLEVEKLANVSNEPNCKIGSEIVDMITEELRSAVSSIHDFVKVLENDCESYQYSSPDRDELIQKIQAFGTSLGRFMSRELGLTEVVLDLSHVLNKAREFKFDIVSCRNTGDEINSSDCIDKVALPEDKNVGHTKGSIHGNGGAQFSFCTSDPNVPYRGSCFSVEEFEQLKLEKENAVLDYARCVEDLKVTKQLLEEAKSKFASAQNSNSLAETQLKCMAESYKSLEIRADDLQNEVNLLQAKVESLESEFQEERRCHQDALTKCRDLEEQLQRNKSCADADHDVKPDQERDLAAATEKLAECQETIFLLGKQLKSLQLETEVKGLSLSKRIRKGEIKTSGNGNCSRDLDQIDSETLGNEAPVEIYNCTLSPVNTEPNSPVSSPVKMKHTKHRHTKSGSSSSSSCGPTPEKYSRGFSRFFSGKGENGC